jgi:hypothetical protein
VQTVLVQVGRAPLSFQGILPDQGIVISETKKETCLCSFKKLVQVIVAVCEWEADGGDTGTSSCFETPGNCGADKIRALPKGDTYG